MSRTKLPEEPQIGLDISLPDWIRNGGGFSGGLCRIVTIAKVDPGNGKVSVAVKVAERPGWNYTWEWILKNQEEWGPKYGNRRSRRIGTTGTEDYGSNGYNGPCSGSCDCS